MVTFAPRYPQKLHSALYHTHRGIAIAAHNTVAEAAMISAYAHSSAVFLTYFYKRCKAFPDAVNFFTVFSIGIFKQLKLLFINIIARINAYFFHDTGCYFGCVRCKMYIGNKRCSIASFM